MSSRGKKSNVHSSRVTILSSPEIFDKNTQPPHNPKQQLKPSGHNVAFQLRSSLKRDAPIHPALRHPRRYYGRADQLTALDHEISTRGGTTSAIENLPHRLRISKAARSGDQKQQIEELTRENGYLRQELAFYKDKERLNVRLSGSLESILQRYKKETEDLEEELLAFWGNSRSFVSSDVR